jgi:putative flippase GtrA
VNERIMALVVSPDFRQFYRFAIVGSLNVLISFAVFVVCYQVWPLASLIFNAAGAVGSWISGILSDYGIHSVDAAFANFCGYAVGMVNSFVLNKIWTFQTQGNTLQQMHRFLILNILGLTLSTLLLFVFVDLLHGPHLVIWFVSTGIVMVMNFYGNKLWTFSDAHQQTAHP